MYSLAQVKEAIEYALAETMLEGASNAVTCRVEDQLADFRIHNLDRVRDLVDSVAEEDLYEGLQTVNIHDLLAYRHEVAHIWTIQDVIGQAKNMGLPIPSEDEAWDILQDVKRSFGSEYGITWLSIELGLSFWHRTGKAGIND